MSGIDELFTKKIPVTLKFQDRENRRASLRISIEMHTVTTPVHRKELVVRLTDESDLFFLYTLHLSEEDFQSLKSQQGLLVDFAAFPQKFVDLLELSIQEEHKESPNIQEEHKESPKFILEIVANGSGAGCTANLNVIETNPFKHLTHLSLKYLPGTDTDVKKYLAVCLKNLKDQNSLLLSRLEQTEGDLSQQLRQAREALSTRTQELDALKTEWAAKTTDMGTKHRQDVTSERERALQTQTSIQQRFDREKRELEQAHTKIVKQLETRLYEIEAANKDLTDRKYKSESTIRELKTKLTSLEEEHHHARQELQTLRKNNAGLDSDYHEQDKVINQLRTRLAVLEQEVKDKEEVQRRTTDLHSSEQDFKRKIEEEIERKKRHIQKLETSIKTMSEELVKGNEIIKKLQAEIKNYHTKLKLRTQVTTEQEKLLGEKNKEMETIRKELEQIKVTFNNKDSENQKLNENLETTMQKLEESRQLLKTNENVINWLNKQVTENQLHRGGGGGGGHGAGAFEMNSAASTGGGGSAYRGIHNYSAGSYRPGDVSTSVRSDLSHPSPNLGATYPQHRQHAMPARHHVHYQPGTMGTNPRPQASNSNTPLAKSSPIGSIPEERLRQDPQASPVLLGSGGHHSVPDPILDSKYFQKSDDVPLRRPDAPHGASIHFTGEHPLGVAGSQGPSIPSINNPTRLNKDAIIPRSMQGYANQHRPPANQQQAPPPLASAYFPAKVT